MTPHYPKCNATALVRDDYGVGDDLEEAVRCLNCGWRIAKPRLEAPKPNAEQKQGDSRQNYSMVPCSRVGCKGKVRRDTPRGLCRNCNIKMTMWEEYTQHTTPPPLIQRGDGTWIDNPKRRTRRAAA